MTVSAPVRELLQTVWEECDPVKATSGPYYKPDFGLPPKKLHVCEARDLNWERGYCLPPYVRAWEFDGTALVEISVEGLPDVKNKHGMYWEIGRIEFAIDAEKKQAVYGYWLGPRYGRGFKKSFDSVSALSFSTKESLVWVS
jgi:hypothetical protein